jgi:hypothetical protein
MVVLWCIVAMQRQVKCLTAIALFKKAINQPGENDNILWCFYTSRFAVQQCSKRHFEA